MKYGLIPLRNFATLGKGLFRSAQPEYSYEYRFITSKLNVHLIVNLRSELRHDNLMAPGDLNVINVDIPDHCTPTVEQADQFISLVREGKRMLFHCEHGQGRTSTFCVLSRLALGGTLEDALREEKEEFGYEFKHPKQLAFLKEYSKKFNH